SSTASSEDPPRRVGTSSAALDLDALDDDGIDRTVASVGLGGGDRIDDAATVVALDFTDDGVPVAEMRLLPDGDEERGAVRAGAGIGHRQQVRAVELQLRMELVGERVTRSAGTGAERATALDHEAVDDPMEPEAVVEPLRTRLARLRVAPLPRTFGETDEVVDGLRRVIGEEFDHDVAAVRLQRRVHVLGHENSSRLGSISVHVIRAFAASGVANT